MGPWRARRAHVPEPCSVMHAAASVRAGGRRRSAATRAARRESPLDDMWACPNCHSLNVRGARQCYSCHAKRPRPGEVDAAPAAATPARGSRAQAGQARCHQADACIAPDRARPDVEHRARPGCRPCPCACSRAASLATPRAAAGRVRAGRGALARAGCSVVGASCPVAGAGATGRGRGSPGQCARRCRGHAFRASPRADGHAHRSDRVPVMRPSGLHRGQLLRELRPPRVVEGGRGRRLDRDRHRAGRNHQRRDQRGPLF